MSLGDYLRTALSSTYPQRVAEAVDQLGPIWGGLTNSGTDALAIQTEVPIVRLMDGQRFFFWSDRQTTTTTPTLQVNDLGAKTIVSLTNTALQVAAILSGRPYEVVYHAATDKFRLINLFTRVKFVDHFNGQIHAGTIAAGDSEVVAHGLSSTPSGVIFLQMKGAIVIEDGDPDATNIYLKNPSSTSSATYKVAVIP